MMSFLLSAFFLISNLFAQDNSANIQNMKTRTMGLGVAVGAPTGLSGKLYLGSSKQNLASPNIALQFSLGGDLGEVGDMTTTLDFIYQGSPLNSTGDEYLFTAYFGGGMIAGAQSLDKSFTLGPRGVLGVTAIIPNNPVELFVEVAPTFVIVNNASDTRFSWSFDGQLGMRYFF